MSNESEVFLAVRAYAASCNFTMALVLKHTCCHAAQCQHSSDYYFMSFNVFAVHTKFSTLSEI